MSDLPSLELLSPRSHPEANRGHNRASQGQPQQQPQGVSAAGSSIEQSPEVDHEQEAHEENGQIRFCALLDYILPESVVLCLEQYCMAVYSCVLQLFSKENEPPQVDNHDQPKPIERDWRDEWIISGGTMEPIFEISTAINKKDGYEFSTPEWDFYFNKLVDVNKQTWDPGNKIEIKYDEQTRRDGTYHCKNVSTGDVTRVSLCKTRRT